MRWKRSRFYTTTLSGKEMEFILATNFPQIDLHSVGTPLDNLQPR